MTTALIDKDAIKKKYAEERAKRIREDGNAQYQRLETNFEDMAADPHTPFKARSPARDHVTFAFIGAGFSGLVVGARLKEAGIDDYRLIEKGGNVGGTWYWNRYPGAQCDTAAMIYLPLLEETGYMPSEKYVHGPEIRGHCERIANQYGLYEKALFHTEVTAIDWQEDTRVWRITTNRGDDFTAKYVGIGTGPLHVAKLPGIEGVADFRGKSFHTSRWDYEYTGGNPEGAPLHKLADKRVAIIGTGATAVQCVPHLARSAGELFVFQRTPSSVDERNNHPIDPEWFARTATPGWQQRWLDNFVENQGRGVPTEDLIDDGWTEISRRIREKLFAMPQEQWGPKAMLAAFEDADFEKMEQIRARVERVVEDDETAQKLKAWYNQLCKRPCFHDDYLAAFNEPGAHLIDTDGRGVEQITETGIVANGKLFEVDCIIYASGFEVGTEYTSRAGFDLRGRGGRTLSEHWANGMRTFHGLHVHGFPNAFIVQPNQAANMISNVPHNILDHARTISKLVAHAEAAGYAEIEPTEDAETAWVETILKGEGTILGSTECTPGYYNNEGQGWSKAFRQAQGHPAGPKGFFEHIEKWRASGEYAGLRFTNRNGTVAEHEIASSPGAGQNRKQTMADLVVYGSPASPFVRKVQVVLAHAGAEYDFETVNIMSLPDWFVEISPARRIPVLRDRTIGETGVAGTIPDSSAISLYLEKRLNIGLYGSNDFEAGRVAWIEEYADTVMALPTGMDFFRPIMFPRFMGKPSDLDKARETWNEKFPRLFDYLEGVLDGGDHFVGGQFSLADIAVACQMTQIDLVAGLPDASKWPALVRHTEAMKARPGFRENLETVSKMFSAILPEKIDLN